MTTATIHSETLIRPAGAGAAVAGASLRRLAVRATGWTLAATYGGQAIRLGSNLVLTRLLFPEAFGVMAIVTLILQSLNLFSDMGIQQSLIQDPRGDDRGFLDTAWTLQVIRGVLLWLAACLAAGVITGAADAGWLPAGGALADPRLTVLLPVAGLSLIAGGFNSTKTTSLRRHLTIGYEAAFQLGSQLFQAMLMVVWALLVPTVWALVGSAVVGSLIVAVASHVVLPGPRNRFAWNPEAAADLIRFGRFILISTIFTFIALNGQRTILGTILSPELFGVYSIALVLSTVMLNVMDRLHGSVLFPLYSQLARRNDPAAMNANVRRVRLRLLAVSLPPMWVLAVFGRQLVGVLYDARYADAGWMLQLLALGAIVAIVSVTLRPIMLAHGHSGRHLACTAIGSLVLLTCMAAGGYAGGVAGVLIGAVVAEFIQYLVLLAFVRRYSIWTPALDFAALALSAVVIAAGWFLLNP
jgi:O-antigen/teichoic acid export membrane protein